MKHYITISDVTKSSQVAYLIKSLSLEGTEVYAFTLVPRDKELYKNKKDKKHLLQLLKNTGTRRIHMSYWAEMVDFLIEKNKNNLLRRFETKENIILYFGDFSGKHLYDRWLQEYELAKELHAEAVTFHAIEYFHIDGLWQFKKSKKEILKGIATIINRFLVLLEEKGFLETGPVIELENAGFGLELGAQTAKDFLFLLEHINDKYNKIKIGWDTNHLLHAVGVNEKTQKTEFFLTPKEITSQMKSLEKHYGDNYTLFCMKWLEINLLYPKLLDKIGSIHLSGAPIKKENIFINGQMNEKYLKQSQKIGSNELKEAFGADIVLKYYDAHTPIDKKLNDVIFLINIIEKKAGQLSIIHELKHDELNKKVLSKQLSIFK